MAELAVPTAAPVLAYARSTIAAQRTTDWEAIRAAIAHQLPAGEPIRITTHTGILICG